MNKILQLFKRFDLILILISFEKKYENIYLFFSLVKLKKCLYQIQYQ